MSLRGALILPGKGKFYLFLGSKGSIVISHSGKSQIHVIVPTLTMNDSEPSV